MTQAEIVRHAPRRAGAAAPAVGAALALDERRRVLRDADERADDLQRPSAALLGRVRRQLRPGLARDRRGRRREATCRSASVEVDTTGRARRPRGRRPAAAPRLPGLGDDPVELQPRAGAALAPDLRLGVRARDSLAYGPWSLGNGHLWRDLLPRRGELGAAAPLAEVRHHARLRFPRARRRGATMRCRSSPISAVLLVLIPVMILTGPDHVAGDGRDLAVARSTSSAAGSRRARSTSSPRRCSCSSSSCIW